MKRCHFLSKSWMVVFLVVISGVCRPGAQACDQHPGLTPVVLFPAFHFTRLQVTVKHQAVAPECPDSGTFTDLFLNDSPSADFSQICQDKLLTMVYDGDGRKPMAKRFSNQRGVHVDIVDYGKCTSAPFYEPLYAFLEANGYERDKSIRVAGYDARLTPDMDGFLERTKALIEKTCFDNGGRPVHLIGHSNGPLYVQYLLTHTSREWKNRFIHGFTPIAGNFPGQGLSYLLLFTGLNVGSATYPSDAGNAASSAAMYRSHPSTYMSSADPAIFQNREVVLANLSGGSSYTPQDYRQLLQDAGLGHLQDIADYYIGFVRFADPRWFPNVDVYAEKGSGLPTPVGAALKDLSTGQIVDADTAFFFRDGDTNQEDITNEAVQAWDSMRCFRFELTDNPGIDHFSLPGNEGVLSRLLANLQRPRSRCR